PSHPPTGPSSASSPTWACPTRATTSRRPDVGTHGHTHTHTHPHPHPHSAVREAPGAPAPGANPMLDIGGDVGAMVVYLDGPTASGELEACPAGGPAERFHTGVHLREIGGGGGGAPGYP